NVGGAFGTALLQTFLTKREQFHSSIINSGVSLFAEPTRQRLAELKHYFLGHGVPDPAQATHQALVAVGRTIHAQALIMGFSDSSGLIGASRARAAIATFSLRKPAAGTGGGAAH